MNTLGYSLLAIHRHVVFLGVSALVAGLLGFTFALAYIVSDFPEYITAKIFQE